MLHYLEQKTETEQNKAAYRIANVAKTEEGREIKTAQLDGTLWAVQTTLRVAVDIRHPSKRLDEEYFVAHWRILFGRPVAMFAANRTTANFLGQLVYPTERGDCGGCSRCHGIVCYLFDRYFLPTLCSFFLGFVASTFLLECGFRFAPNFCRRLGYRGRFRFVQQQVASGGNHTPTLAASVDIRFG
uniref:Uncharacterized protein n=1 Tax=Anopheles culicifacies TaxID=139723 RepID=A0A182MU96_9DIPT